MLVDSVNNKVENANAYQLVSIEDMCELESLGIDVSDASCMWTSINDKEFNPIYYLGLWRGNDKQPIEVLRNAFPYTYKEGNIYYAYTLEDILQKLPKVFNEGKGLSYYFVVRYENDNVVMKYITKHGRLVLHKEMGKTHLECAFKMLKWYTKYNK